MEEHNLQAQTGTRNTQDNSKGKTVNNHNRRYTLNVQSDGLLLLLLVLLGVGFLLIVQPWQKSSDSKPQEIKLVVETSPESHPPTPMLSRPESARGPRPKLDPVAGAPKVKLAATDSPAVIFARIARGLPKLSKVYKAEFVSKKPEILRDNGTKQLAAWRINVSYDMSTYEQVARVMNDALSAVAKTSAEGVTFDMGGKNSALPKNKKVFPDNLDYDDHGTIDQSDLYTQAEFGTCGNLQKGSVRVIVKT
ncbi:MAG: hypothetical protein ACOYOF_16010 [Verrucomicrobiaceae bacterium]